MHADVDFGRRGLVNPFLQGVKVLKCFKISPMNYVFNVISIFYRVKEYYFIFSRQLDTANTIFFGRLSTLMCF